MTCAVRPGEVSRRPLPQLRCSDHESTDEIVEQGLRLRLALSSHNRPWTPDVREVLAEIVTRRA